MQYIDYGLNSKDIAATEAGMAWDNYRTSMREWHPKKSVAAAAAERIVGVAGDLVDIAKQKMFEEK